MGQYLQNLSQKVITVTLCRFGLHNMNNILHHENSVEVINHTNLYNIMYCTYANKRFALLLGADKWG